MYLINVPTCRECGHMPNTPDCGCCASIRANSGPSRTIDEPYEYGHLMTDSPWLTTREKLRLLKRGASIKERIACGSYADDMTQQGALPQVTG